eukprot:TRINITY_DN17830_c0_g1_i1.p1 TRINITY_DN17830_c0_g1~~TRINITY_DN17830_c0_g1_i1.p1  ORF type:complete len:765 (-),score=71.16 TRINITY_DN17830_c0_g1_i1:168-2462(-)
MLCQNMSCVLNHPALSRHHSGRVIAPGRAAMLAVALAGRRCVAEGASADELANWLDDADRFCGSWSGNCTACVTATEVAVTGGPVPVRCQWIAGEVGACVGVPSASSNAAALLTAWVKPHEHVAVLAGGRMDRRTEASPVCRLVVRDAASCSAGQGTPTLEAEGQRCAAAQPSCGGCLAQGPHCGFCGERRGSSPKFAGLASVRCLTASHDSPTTLFQPSPSGEAVSLLVTSLARRRDACAVRCEGQEAKFLLTGVQHQISPAKPFQHGLIEYPLWRRHGLRSSADQRCSWKLGGLQSGYLRRGSETTTTVEGSLQHSLSTHDIFKVSQFRQGGRDSQLLKIVNVSLASPVMIPSSPSPLVLDFITAGTDSFGGFTFEWEVSLDTGDDASATWLRSAHVEAQVREQPPDVRKRDGKIPQLVVAAVIFSVLLVLFGACVAQILSFRWGRRASSAMVMQFESRAMPPPTEPSQTSACADKSCHETISVDQPHRPKDNRQGACFVSSNTSGGDQHTSNPFVVPSRSSTPQEVAPALEPSTPPLPPRAPPRLPTTPAAPHGESPSWQPCARGGRRVRRLSRPGSGGSSRASRVSSSRPSSGGVARPGGAGFARPSSAGPYQSDLERRNDNRDTILKQEPSPRCSTSTCCPRPGSAGSSRSTCDDGRPPWQPCVGFCKPSPRTCRSTSTNASGHSFSQNSSSRPGSASSTRSRASSARGSRCSRQGSQELRFRMSQQFPPEPDPAFPAAARAHVVALRPLTRCGNDHAG